jgi:hypothetical protein
MVDVIFADVAQPDQARIVALNAHLFLKAGGHVVISIKANCIDSTAPAEAVFESERNKLAAEKIKPIEQLTLEASIAFVLSILLNLYIIANSPTNVIMPWLLVSLRPMWCILWEKLTILM